MQSFADVVRCACSSWEGSVALPIGVVADRVSHGSPSRRDSRLGGSSTTHAHNSNRWYYACKARRAWRQPLEFADTLNTEQPRVIASEIAPDIHTLFRLVVLFTWICTCHACKLSLLACNDAPGTIRGLRGPTTPELLTAFSHLNTNRLPQDEPNRSYDFPHHDWMQII